MAAKDKLRMFKVVLVGNCNVGKTSTLMRLDGKEFGNPAPIGKDFTKKDYQVSGGGSVSLQIFDTAGMERLRSMSPNYLRNAHAVVLMYDLNNKTTFLELDKWEQYVRNNEPGTNPVFRFLVGNKSDLEIDIEDDKISESRDAFGVEKDFRTSAKTGDGIEETFRGIANYLARTCTSRRSSTAIGTDNVDLGLQIENKANEPSTCSC